MGIMKLNCGLTSWLVIIQLLVVLKSGFVSSVCTINPSTVPLTENVPQGEVIYSLAAGNWAFTTSVPPGYITLAQNSSGFYLKAEKVFDVEVMKVKVVIAYLKCNGDRKITFPLTEKNEFPPSFKQPSYAVNVKEDASKGTVVFKAADHVTDDDFSKNFKFSTLPQSGGQVPDGVASGMFQVASNGEVTVAGNLDFEKQKEYIIEIEVKEDSFINTTKLTISLVDVDDRGPTFIVSNVSITTGIAFYQAEISVYHMGEIPINGGPIFAKDTESNNYAVMYTSLFGNMVSYFSLDSTSGKISVIKKLPEDIASPNILQFQAEDISPQKKATSAGLIITINKDPITTTQEPTTITTEPSKTTEITTPTPTETTTSPTKPTSSSTSMDLSSLTPGQNQSSPDSLTSTSPTGSSSSFSSASVSLGENQTTRDPLQSVPPTGSPSLPSSSTSSSSVTLGMNQTTRDPLQSTPPTGIASSSSLVSFVTSGQNGTATDSSQSSTSPTGATTTSLPLSQTSVTPGKDKTTPGSLLSTLPPSQYTSEVSNGQGQTTGNIPTNNSSVPSTTPRDVADAEPYSTGEFFGAVGVLLFIIIILLVVIVLGFCWWKKRKDDDQSFREANLADTKPLGIREYDNISKASSKMNGVENNAANLSDLLENGEMPKENYNSELYTAPPMSGFVENTENEGTYDRISEAPDNAVVGPPSSPFVPDQPPIDTFIYDKLEDVESNNPEAVDKINDNTEAASQLSSEAPVTMTFADLGKNASVSFAEDPKDNVDNGPQTDGLSYVDHINSGDDNDSNPSDSADKPAEKPKDEEMTWLVADNDGNQLSPEDNEGSPAEIQRQLSGNNEIGYAPLLDDSQRDLWGTPNLESDDIRL